MDAKQRVVFGIGFLVCVLAGAGIEHARLAVLGGPGEDEPEVKETVQVTKTPGRAVTLRDEAAERAAEALRKRVAELEKALAGREAASVQQEPPPQTEASREEQDANRRQSREEREERMKAEDPERYAEMQQRREEFRQRMEQRARDRADFLDAVDRAGMSPDQRVNHEKLLETVARVNELTTQMMQQQPGRGRTEEGDALRQEMGESMMALGQLYDSERQYLLEATAKAAGYSGGDVSAFTEHVQSIIENTTMMPSAGGYRGGPGGPGGGPGGGREGGGAPPPAQ
jgi:hypothetical protein